MNKYIFDEYETPAGLENETTVNFFDFNIERKQIRVLYTKDNKYINCYIISEMFKTEPLNNLNNQEDLTENNLKNISEKEAFKTAISFYLWYKYGNPEPDKVLSFWVEESE